MAEGRHLAVAQLATGAVVTASGVIGPASVQIPFYTRAVNIGVTVLASAVGGTTPSYTLEVQWSPDGTNWASAETPDTFTAITANKNVSKSFTVKGQYYRLNATVTGTTPTATITAQAVVN